MCVFMCVFMCVCVYVRVCLSSQLISSMLQESMLHGIGKNEVFDLPAPLSHSGGGMDCYGLSPLGTGPPLRHSNSKTFSSRSLLPWKNTSGDTSHNIRCSFIFSASFCPNSLCFSIAEVVSVAYHRLLVFCTGQRLYCQVYLCMMFQSAGVRGHVHIYVVVALCVTGEVYG